jgi:serine/threonine protein kinase
MVKKSGGKVIASGGFGCVFRPSLKCKGHKTRSKNKITKLMIKKYALEEYDDIQKYESILKKIPNYSDYFLINDFHLCQPAPLDSDDLYKFKNKCSALPKNDINETNINDSLDKLYALNMPDGGIALDDFINENGSYYTFISLNNCLNNLLVGGISQMNKKNIYHCDIKDSNILVERKSTDLYTRLIDWGLSTYYIPYKNSNLPKTWRNRPLQFNVPFSVILFTDKFYEKYTLFLEENDKKINETILKPFIVNYLYYWLKERGPGHYRFINKIMYQLFSNELKNVDNSVKDTLIETDFTVSYITNYLMEILLNYTFYKKDGSLNLRIYLDEVFIKIIDIYGLVSSYYPIFRIYYDNYNTLSENEMDIFNKLKEIFIKYLYSPRIKPIIINELSNDLLSLNLLFKNENPKDSTPPSLKVVSKKSRNTKRKMKVPLFLSKHSTRRSLKK